MKTGSVYFVKTEGLNVFKIGHCTSDLNKRLDMLRIGNHLRLSFFGIINQLDALEIERRLHAQFASSRIRGEWFDLSEDEAIKAIRENGGVLVPIQYGRIQTGPKVQRMNGRFCGACDKPLMGKRYYCSDACKAAAYRERKRKKETA